MNKHRISRQSRVLTTPAESLDSLFEHLPGMVYRCRNDASWTMLFVSAGVVALTGYRADELIENKCVAWSDIIHPDDRDSVGKHGHEILESGQPYELSYRIIAADKTLKWVWERGQAYASATDDGVMLEGYITDITSYKQTESALVESQRQQKQILESVGDGIHGLDLNGNIIFENPAALALLGWEENEIIGRQSHATIHHHYQNGQVYPRASCPIYQSLRDGQTRRITDEVFFCKDGSSFPVEYVCSAIHDQAGTITGAVVNFRDITELRMTREALRDSEERFRRILQDVPNVAIQGYGLDGSVHYWNAASEQLYGYTEAEALNSNLLDLIIPSPMRPAVSDELRKVREGMENIPAGLLQLKRKDGSLVDVYSSHTVLRRPGSSTELYCIDVDMTAQKQAEEQLRQSQRLESIGQLTGGVAHDFNNLLTVILGNAELLSELLADDPRKAAMAEMVMNAAQRGAELTQRLLAFARKQALDPKLIDVSLLIKGMDSLLRRTLGEHIEIEMKLSPDICQALIDPAQLESALLNLGLNARDAMPSGGHLTIQTSRIWLDQDYTSQYENLLPGNYTMLAVSDTGCGVAPENLQKVFEPFFTTKETGKGTGLGLAMVYGFVKQSGGHINIYSEPGLGTCVKLYLPMVSDIQQSSDPADIDVDVVGGSGTVLVVEDDDLVRQFATNQIVALGYNVVEAANGQQALEILRLRPDIDLLFTDVVMPGMSGRQLVDAVTAMRPDLKVLYSSGYTEDAIVHHGRLDPGVQLLGKPYRRADLARKLREVFAEAR